jgi:hypothetical protein
MVISIFNKFNKGNNRRLIDKNKTLVIVFGIIYGLLVIGLSIIITISHYSRHKQGAQDNAVQSAYHAVALASTEKASTEEAYYAVDFIEEAYYAVDFVEDAYYEVDFIEDAYYEVDFVEDAYFILALAEEAYFDKNKKYTDNYDDLQAQVDFKLDSNVKYSEIITYTDSDQQCFKFKVKNIAPNSPIYDYDSCRFETVIIISPR